LPSWLELSVIADAEAVEAVSEVLQRVASGGVAIEPPFEADREGGVEVPLGRKWLVKAYLSDVNASSAEVRSVEQALWHLNAIWPVGELSTRAVDEEDWANAWKDHYHPIRIGQNTVICPRWREVASREGDVVIHLDPGMAFGTGLHPTTQLCLEALEEVPLTGKSVLDLGCGSGVLAISAAMRGAASVRALDVDPVAVRTTRENAEINGVRSAVTIEQGSLPEPESRRYDIVLANIIAQVIIDLAPNLRAAVAPAGTLIASGIIDDKVERTVAALRDVGFTCVARQRGDWFALICQASDG
jgi:ribosomal protein L11 methyltransferase